MTTSYRGAVRQLLRDRLLDAGREELRGRAWAQVTMADIAAAGGVSRQTLYNEFGTRDEFGQALVIRESSRLLDAVEQTIAEHADDPIAALTAALECFLTIATSDPFVRLLLGDEIDASSSFLLETGRGDFDPIVTDGYLGEIVAAPVVSRRRLMKPGGFID